MRIPTQVLQSTLTEGGRLQEAPALARQCGQASWPLPIRWQDIHSASSIPDFINWQQPAHIHRISMILQWGIIPIPLPESRATLPPQGGIRSLVWARQKQRSSYPISLQL